MWRFLRDFLGWAYTPLKLLCIAVAFTLVGVIYVYVIVPLEIAFFIKLVLLVGLLAFAWTQLWKLLELLKKHMT